MGRPSTPMFVREVMTRRVGVVDATATVEEVRRIADREDLAAVAVVHRRRLIVALTRQDLNRAALGVTSQDATTWYEQLDGRSPVLLAPDDLTAGLSSLFERLGASVAVVVDHGDVLGVVTPGLLPENVRSTEASLSRRTS
jgi:predicted transcriptional regulator